MAKSMTTGTVPYSGRSGTAAVMTMWYNNNNNNNKIASPMLVSGL